MHTYFNVVSRSKRCATSNVGSMSRYGLGLHDTLVMNVGQCQATTWGISTCLKLGNVAQRDRRGSTTYVWDEFGKVRQRRGLDDVPANQRWAMVRSDLIGPLACEAVEHLMYETEIAGVQPRVQE